MQCPTRQGCQEVIISGARLPLQVIAQHLFQEGKFTVGERFVEEAGVMNGEQLRQPFTEMHEVLERVSACWCAAIVMPLTALHRDHQVLNDQIYCSGAIQVQLCSLALGTARRPSHLQGFT